MKTGVDVARARGLKFEDFDGSIPVEEFTKVGLPMIVACTGCTMTMAFPEALVDDDGCTWCDDCSGEEVEELRCVGCDAYPNTPLYAADGSVWCGSCVERRDGKLVPKGHPETAPDTDGEDFHF